MSLNTRLARLQRQHGAEPEGDPDHLTPVELRWISTADLMERVARIAEKAIAANELAPADRERYYAVMRKLRGAVPIGAGHQFASAPEVRDESETTN